MRPILANYKEVLATPGPRLIDLQLTPSEILYPKVAALPQADGSMLSMPLEDMSPLPLEQLQTEMQIPLLPQSQAARQPSQVTDAACQTPLL